MNTYNNKYIIAGVVIVFITVAGILSVRGEQKAPVALSPERVYTDTEYDYHITYPADWQVSTTTLLINSGEAVVVFPAELVAFPECQQRFEKLLENHKQYNPIVSEASIYDSARAESCSIGITTYKNPQHLSIKDFLQDGFMRGTAYQQADLDLIATLTTEKTGRGEEVLSDTAFYLHGFGGGYDGEVVPGVIVGKQQFIIAHNDTILFVHNSINPTDATLPGSHDIFEKLIKSITFN